MSEITRKQAAEIRDEVLVSNNTAKKVGGVLVAMVDEMDKVFRNVSDVKGLSPRGSYDNETLYERLDIIEHRGSSYLVLQKFIGIEPEGDNIITMRLARKGDSFVYEDFTPEQLAALKGEKGDAFTYADFTPEQLEGLKVKGDAFAYEDFTPEQLAALKGEKGDTGKGLTILGYYGTLDLLKAGVTAPEPGDAYGIGEAAPYEIHVFDGVTNDWVNNGQLSGGGDIYVHTEFDVMAFLSGGQFDKAGILQLFGGEQQFYKLIDACKAGKTVVISTKKEIQQDEITGKVALNFFVTYQAVVVPDMMENVQMNIGELFQFDYQSDGTNIEIGGSPINKLTANSFITSYSNVSEVYPYTAKVVHDKIEYNYTQLSNRDVSDFYLDRDITTLTSTSTSEEISNVFDSFFESDKFSNANIRLVFYETVSIDTNYTENILNKCINTKTLTGSSGGNLYKQLALKFTLVGNVEVTMIVQKDTVTNLYSFIYFNKEYKIEYGFFLKQKTNEVIRNQDGSLAPIYYKEYCYSWLLTGDETTGYNKSDSMSPDLENNVTIIECRGYAKVKRKNGSYAYYTIGQDSNTGTFSLDWNGWLNLHIPGGEIASQIDSTTEVCFSVQLKYIKNS